MYIISHKISEDLKPLWFEESVYKKENLYSIRPNVIPPVNYDSHTINSHSVTHIETSKHTQENGKSIDWYYNNSVEHFYGEALVLKLKGDNYIEVDSQKKIFHWEVSLKELQKALANRVPTKVLITTENYPNINGFHDPKYVLTLSQEAADYLISIKGFNLFGTTWKSSDYNPGSLDRPIHNTLFKKAVILELIKLDHVPEGEYLLSALPLNIQDASESPVMATLQSTK